MNLSLTGNLGSGKSSLGKELIARGFEIVSSGDIFRGLAAERGVSIVEMNKIAETDKSIDKMVDDRTIALGKSKDNTIFDSRMGWYFVPDSFKVFVMVDLAEAGRRVYNDSLRKAETYQDERDAVKALYTRQSLEKERYGELYGVNYYDLDNYDLVIDSTSASPAAIAEEIICRFEQYKSGDHTKHIEISPYRIYPTKSCRNTETHPADKTFSDSVQNGKDTVIKTALSDGKWYALSGHETLLAAQKKKESFVCISVSKEPASSTKQLCGEYEKQAGFTYRAYPEEKQEFSNEKMYW
jgi:cytidylate kinase